MSIHRLAASFLQNRLRSSRSIQQLGSCRKFQWRNYNDMPKHKGKRIDDQYLFPEKPLGVKSSSWSIYMVPAGFLTIAAGIGFLFHYNDERRAVLKGEGNEHAKKTIYGPKFGGPFSLFDTENRLVTDRELLGNWILLYFGYTSSPDVGPEEVQKIAKALDILDSKKIVLVPIFVTIDPQRDSPSQLRAYLKEFDPRIVGLTGSISAIRQVAQEYRVYFKKVEEDGNDYLVDSSHKMYLLDPNLDIVRCFGTEYGGEKLSEEIQMEMSKSSK